MTKPLREIFDALPEDGAPAYFFGVKPTGVRSVSGQLAGSSILEFEAEFDFPEGPERGVGRAVLFVPFLTLAADVGKVNAGKALMSVHAARLSIFAGNDTPLLGGEYSLIETTSHQTEAEVEA